MLNQPVYDRALHGALSLPALKGGASHAILVNELRRMNRITRRFADLRQAGRKALIRTSPPVTPGLN